MDLGRDALQGVKTRTAHVSMVLGTRDLNMQPFFVWLESSAFSMWLRNSESIFAFPAILTLHTASMGFLAGLSAAIDLRVLGFAPRVPLREMKKFLPIIWISFWVSMITGINLLIAYPTKALTNPIFYLKLMLIALSIVVVRLIATRALPTRSFDSGPLPRNVRTLAAISIICWLLLIWAGRALPYTYGRLFATDAY